MHKTIAAIGAVNTLLAIALGAFLAHALDGQLSSRMQEVYATAVEYHTWHALGLILLALCFPYIQRQQRMLMVSAQCMILGIVLFCGSLYLLAVTQLRWLGMITPFGGLSFMLAWLLLAIAFWRER